MDRIVHPNLFRRQDQHTLGGQQNSLRSYASQTTDGRCCLSTIYQHIHDFNSFYFERCCGYCCLTAPQSRVRVLRFSHTSQNIHASRCFSYWNLYECVCNHRFIYCMWVHGALRQIDQNPIRVYSKFTSSIPGISSRFTATMTRIKWLLNIILSNNIVNSLINILIGPQQSINIHWGSKIWNHIENPGLLKNLILKLEINKQRVLEFWNI